MQIRFGRQNYVMRAAALFAASVSFTAFAGSEMYLPPHDNYPGARAQGMGGAFASVADDESAIFYNPAGVGNEDGKQSKNILRGASFPNFSLGFDKSPNDLQKAMVRTTGPANERLEGAVNEFNKTPLRYLRASAFPYITIWRFQLGVVVDEEMEVYRSKYDTAQTSQYSSAATPLTYDTRLSILSRAQSGAVVGFSVPHKKLGLSVGVAARAMTRTTIVGDYETSAAVLSKSIADMKEDVNKSSGIGVDAGILYTITPKWAPTFGLAFRDIANTQYKPKSADHATEIEKMNVSFGFSCRPPLGKYMNSTFALEGTRLSDNRVVARDKMRAGFELGIGNNDVPAPIALRAGYQGRAVSYGASLDLLLFKVDVARYGEIVDGPQGKRVDKRTLARLSVDLR